MKLKRKYNVTSADYLSLPHVLEVLLIEEVSADVVGLKTASITLVEFLMQLLSLYLRYFILL